MQVTRRFLRICTVNRRWLRWLAPVVAVLIITSLALATVAPTVFRTRPVAAAKVACPAVLPDAAAALLTAKLCRGSILVADLTTETDSTTANADGTETLTHNYRPVRVQRDGAWAPVDATLVVNTDGSIGPRAAAIDLRLSGGGNTNLAQLSEDGVTISLGSPVGVLPVPQLAGAMATYANVLPDVDLQVTADEDGFSEYFVVKNATAGANPALTSLAFPISVVGGALSSDTAGNITVKDVHGSALFAAAAPQMWAGDENMPPAPGNDLAPPQPPQGAAPPIKATMGVSLAGHTLRLVPNQAMLTSPLATFPVILDPTFTSTRLNWTWVDSGAPTTSHWDDSGDARVGTSDSGASVRRSFFQMDMAAVNGKHINSATFTIPEVWAWSCTPEPVEIWETYGISTATTWNAQPTFLAKNDTSTTAKGWSSAGEGGASPCPSGNVSFNVTAALRDAASKSWGHATLALKASNETSDLSWKRFGNNPTIAITYNTPPPVPNTFSMTPQSGTLDCSGGTTGFIGVNSRTPTLQAVVRSADGTAVRGDFHLWDTNTLATIIATRGAGSESAFVASGAVAKVTSPALTEGHAYSWQVEADDGTVYSTVYTSNCHFYVDTTAPAVAPTVAST